MTYRDVVLADTPIMLFEFRETSGTFFANSMGGISGTLSGSGTLLNQPGPLGTDMRAVTFNGNGVINLPTSFTQFNIDGNFTWEAWAKFTSTANGYPTVLRRDGNSHVTILRASIDPGTPAVFDAYADGHAYGVTVMQRDWVHLVMVKAGTVANAYVNGIKCGKSGTIPGAYSYAGGSQAFLIGSGSASVPSGEAMIGSVSGVAVYDQALTDDRVYAHYQAAIPTGTDTGTGTFRGWGIPL